MATGSDAMRVERPEKSSPVARAAAAARRPATTAHTTLPGRSSVAVGEGSRGSAAGGSLLPVSMVEVMERLFCCVSAARGGDRAASGT